MIDVLFNKMLLIFFEIKKIVFDRKALFTNDYWSTLCYRIRVVKRLNTVFHSQTDSQIKRQNQTLKHYLRYYCNYKQNNWRTLLLLIQYVYNNASHAFTDLSFFKIVFEIKANFQFNWDNKRCSNVFAAKNRIQFLWNERDKLI